MPKLLGGKPVALEIDNETIEHIKKNSLSLKLAIVVSQASDAAMSYSRQIQNKAKRLNIETQLVEVSGSITQEEANSIISGLSKDENINGIIIQSPLNNVDIDFMRMYLDPSKDVDGTTETSLGRLFEGKPGFVPATAAAVIKILEYYKIDTQGKNAVVIGRSTVVGKPLTHLLLQKNATVSVCHSKTKDLGEFTKKADIVISAAGKPELVTGDMVNKNSVVIDVGTNFIGGKTVGDVSFEQVSEAAAAISPVPGGVGPVTTSVLLNQFAKSAKLKH